MAKKRGAKVFPKSKNGQKKCPIFRRVRILGGKRQKKTLCEHKGKKSYKKLKKCVTIILKYFAEKDLGIFSVDK